MGLNGLCAPWPVALAFLLFMATTGCNSEPQIVEGELPETQARLMDIQLAYSRFIEQAGRPPRNEKELLRTLESQNPEETLVSPRDGQPFVICYGVSFYEVNWAKPNSTPIIAYEQQGDGTRWVLSPPGMIHEVEEEEFRNASFPPGHKVKN